ncbi:uncharacterized protein H6S33_003507 [Morchella sextelata]|uniref:uncharacterized protein n=1 Tax=Morchella sextelata TaxID=1174677 RepID=UPI001D040F88|nr:uncharacterized protein H6S33_003507 [Morchella sextelata]KAH0606673.1 hypothetical protein H6S33_003507 [Morchella sextelata]
MASIARPTMVSNPSSQSEVSSPPPSPVETATPSSPTAARQNEKQTLVDHHHSQRQQQPLLGIDTTVTPATEAEIVVKTPTNRPRLPGRQETPPSPPNSVVLGPSPVSPDVPLPVGPSVYQRMGLGHPEDSTPPASLKQRITRVFKVGHKRGESDLSRTTNTTDDTIQRDTSSSYLPTPLKENSPMQPNRPSFYARQSTGPIRPISQFDNGGGSNKRIISGGEVRVEILPHSSLMVGDSSRHGYSLEESPKGGRDDSDRYYRYYSRSTRLGNQELGEEEEETESRVLSSGIEENNYLPPLNRFQAAPPPTPTHRRQTATTIESAGSQERRYVEESMAFGFEGFHIGNGSGFSDGTYAGLSGPSSPTCPSGTSVYEGSGKASSSVLNYMNQSDLNASSRNGSNKTTLTNGRGSGGMSRPVMSRNASSNSYFSPGMCRLSSGVGRSGSPQLDEAVNRELKRLSKISAGSGASGFAMVITADGATSTRFDRDFSDEEMDVIASERKYTREEKGKGKAVPSSSSESVAGRKDGESHNGYQGAGHHHTISDASKFIRSDGSEHSSDNGDSDGIRLLSGMGGFGARRKLKSQEVPKGVLVHEGDPRYEFVYRMRQTSDETPILVPQYFYPSDGFPNRNALTTPTRSTFSPLSSINTSNAGAMPFAGQYGSSPIAMPKNVLTRDSSSSFYMRMGGDQAVDSRNCSPRSPRFPEYGSMPGSPFESNTHSPNETTPIHPALRSPEQTPVHKGGRRQDISTGNQHGIEMDLLVTGTPGGTGRRLAGSSLAGGSDTMSNDRLGVDTRKQVRMSGIDEVNFIPPLQDSTTNASRKKESRSWASLYGTRLPRRPKDLRRSMTPRLYDPRRISDSWTDISNDDPEAMRGESHNRTYRMQEKRLGRIILALCVLFPPLLLLVAIGSFDAMVDSWSNGEVKGVGKSEKRIAAIVGGVLAVSAVVGGVVAAIVVAS